MRIGAVAIQMLLLALPLYAADPLAAFVGSDALVELRAGAAVKAGLPQDATPSLVPNVSSREIIEQEVKDLGPSVGAEFLKVIPGPGIAMDAPAGQLLLFNAMHAVSTMKGVTYWSVTRGKEQVLFLQSYVIASPAKPDRIPDPVFSEIPETHELFTFQEDSSFGKNTFLEHFHARGDHLYVKMENLSTITFLLIPFIQPQGLVSQVVLVPIGTDVLFYGLACIRTGMPLGDKASRVESMENRLTALAGWLEKRLSAGAG
ncbi:MAG: DUF6675 family protein [Spirochaetia bacterium]|jgi:hypothetical protein